MLRVKPSADPIENAIANMPVAMIALCGVFVIGSMEDLHDTLANLQILKPRK